MIIYPLNILMLPLLLIVWAIDAYLFIAAVRWLSRQIAPESALASRLQQITQPPVHRISNWLSRKVNPQAASWLSWVILLLGLFVIRHAIITFMFAANKPPLPN